MYKTEIKLITTDNVTELQKISRETFKDTFGQENTDTDMQQYLDTTYSTKQLLNELKNPNTRFYFLVANRKIAGYLKLNVNQAQSDTITSNALEVERIYIRKGFKHRGFGTKLIQYAIEKAKAAGKSKIWLGVWEHNEPAKHFYTKMGFTQIGDHVFQLGSDKQRDLIMLKKLNNN